jgi:diguanylate cyclase (GGDEF)-like protein
VLILDIDHFKQINDRHGHLVGDEVIRRVSAILRDCARRADVVGRCGGEEFGLVLPETGAEAAALMAERIRARIESEVLCESPAVRATVSIGIAPLPALDIQDHIRWVVSADRALYEAKRLGRNRCVCLAWEPRAEAGFGQIG